MLDILGVSLAKAKKKYFLRDRKIESVGDVIAALRLSSLEKKQLWFRGHSSVDWKLLPSLCRSSKIQNSEALFIKRFKQNAFRLIQSPPASEWEWLFLMQHYRVPTRLLDWTEHPLIGLYFAINDKSYDKEDAIVWSLLPIDLNKSASIDFANKNEIPLFESETSNPIKNYLPSVLATEHTSNLQPAAGIALRNSSRIAAQFGVFTITHRKNIPLEEVGEGEHLFRLIVPKAAKARLRKEIQLLKINQFTVFPELDSVCMSIGDDIYD